jgi:hypothetical protein
MTIALPTISRNAGTSKYAFKDLVVGGPALVETDVVNAAKVSSRLQSALAADKKRDESLKAMTFKIRTFTLEGKDCVGVWRVA